MKTKDRVYQSLGEVKESLKGLGYKHLYEVDEDNTLRSDNGVKYPIEEVVLDEMREFREKDSDEPTSVYALSTKDGAKGIMLDGFGVTGSVHRTNFLKHLTDRRTIK